MIKYKLICKECNLSFDSWFASSDEYEKLKKRKFLNCHNCDSKEIEKTLMAPKLKLKNEDNKDLKFNHVYKKIKEYQKFIKKNFNYVGENFAYEARLIHYDNKKNSKGIYGKASIDEINELKDEGIATEMIPWIEDKNN